MNTAKIVFMGTPEFAVPALRALHESYAVLAVVTQPDRPRGRGRQVAMSPVKAVALELGTPVLQPEKVRDPQFREKLAALNPDFIITAAYGQLLPAELLALPAKAALNIHASLLPRYRGPAPIHRAVMNGDSETGVTIIHMDRGMDSGDIVLKRSIPIGFHDTTGIVHDRLAALGAELICEAVEAIWQNKAARHPQDHREATYAAPLSPDEEIIDWKKSALAIHNQVRGMNPWPGAYTLVDGKRIKIWQGVPEKGEGIPGTVFRCGPDGVLVAAGDGAYRIEKLQPAGKRALTAAEFICGRNVQVGQKLGGGEAGCK